LGSAADRLKECFGVAKINGFDTDALAHTVEAVRENRELGRVTFAVEGQWQGGVALKSHTGALTQAGARDETRSGRFTMASDEPIALLGTDTAVSPGEHLLQALAGCYTVTLVANAAARGIKLNDYRLELAADFDLSGFLGIDPDVPAGSLGLRVNVELDAPDAGREELEDLIRAVEERSPIRNTIVSGVAVTTSLA
jgi:uncharacterized OsmC-like protein